jgi:hypothetical protein
MSLTTQPPSTVSIIAQNSPEDSNCDTSSSPIVKDSKDKELEDARSSTVHLSNDHPDWINRSRAFASLLSKRFDEMSRHKLLAECIDIQRQICSVCTTGHPDRAVSVTDLATSLQTYFVRFHFSYPSCILSFLDYLWRTCTVPLTCAHAPTFASHLYAVPQSLFHRLRYGIQFTHCTHSRTDCISCSNSVLTYIHR